MRVLSTAALLLFVAPLAGAQVRTPAPRAQAFTMLSSAEAPDRPMLGVSTSGGDKRDTLGLLVTDVMPSSPAEKAGLEEGNRLVSINGVSLRVAREDAGEPEMESAMSNRLRREIGKHKAGDEVTIEVLAAGKVKSVKAKLVAAADLTERRSTTDDEHGVLGITLSSTGSKRDTAGVFISAVHDGGPADKAGVAEGDRIASINGVDLRVPREDVGDASVSESRMQRLQRELRKVKPGQAVDLVVVSGGKQRTVKVTTAKASEVKGWEGAIAGTGGGMIRIPGGISPRIFMEHLPTPPVPPIAPQAPSAPRPPSAPRVRIFRDGDVNGFMYDDVAGARRSIERTIERTLPAAMERARIEIENARGALQQTRVRIVHRMMI